MFHRKHNAGDIEDHDAKLQEQKVGELKAAIGPLSGRSSAYCTDACLKRYLRARNWNVTKSKKMLQESLKWRSAYKPEEIPWHEVAVEGETGKGYRAGFHDRDGRTVLVMTPAKQNTTSHENQVRHLVYLLENAILNLPEELEEMVWLIDFTGWSLANAVPIRTARESASILQNHYPERLSVAFLYNPPRIFEAFWKIAKMFLDPVTMKKVKFVYPKNMESMELLKQRFDADALPVQFGGRSPAEYNHEEFSRMMIKDDIKAAAVWGLEEDKPADGA
ncbi:Patellin-6 [Platanthera zijinensis]|uniref:Patellin-6 n=1 Tax=Platanthera zijinensis TaxID=2320716 RepID=A0AAP0C0Q3_9ASPA